MNQIHLSPIIVTEIETLADPEGATGGMDPQENHELLYVSMDPIKKQASRL